MVLALGSPLPPPLPFLPLPPSHLLPRHLGVLVLCCGVLTGCISSRPTSQGVARIETGCPRVPASRHCDHERRLPPPPTALLLFHGSRSAGVGPGLVDCPPSYPMCCPSVCACGVWCGMCVWSDFARVCRSRPVPTCEGPVCHVPAPAAAQDLQLPREQTVEAVIPFAGGRHGSLHALSPHSPRSPPPPHWWVCVQSRVWHAHVARRRLGSHATAWQLVVRGGGRPLVPRMRVS